MNFSEVYKKYATDIHVVAYGQRIIGLDYDDVVSEMLTCLWKAWKTYVPGTTSFGSYWWSVWMNRKFDLIAEATRQKRPRHVLVGNLLDETSVLPQHPGYTMARWPDAPHGSDDLERNVWNMLAAGETGTAIRARWGISKRRYYEILSRWRNKGVWDHLLHHV